MENNQELSKDSERRKLQEDIERLRDVIGDDDFNSDDETDENILQIDFNSTVPTEGDEEFRQTPGAISSCAGSVIPEASADDDDDRDEIVINLNENVPIDPDTCLALNKAYQEVLLDTLRSIEMALIENRDKQDRIHENFVENPKKLKASADCKRSVTSYQRPFFMDKNGNVPPPNTDVVIKKSTDEQRQDIKPSFPWRKKMKEELKQAVYLNALDQQTRPLLNRKEIYYEKLALMSKEANGEEYYKMSEKIDELDTEIQRLSMLEKDEILNMADIKRIDWMKISNTTMNNVRDPGECELYWNNELKPSINKQQWTKSEKEKLKELAEKYDHKNWPTIAEELGTNRTPFQCLQYYQQNLNEVFNKRPWTELEDQMLIEVVENCRVGTTISWTQVSYFMEGRSSMQCSQRWVQINPEIKRGKWSEEEDMKLLSAVYLYGEKDWEKIAEFVPQRSVAQCRERYKSSLNPNLRPPHVWTYEEDRRMLVITEQLKKEDGKIPWAQAAEMMEGRSDNMILCRHRKLTEWKEKCEWLEKQDPKVRTELGYIDLEGLARGDSKSKKNRSLRKSKDPETRDKETADDYKRLLHQLSKLPVNEYKFDYITQLKDKREGNFVVPRPPLMYRYTRRNTTNIWARKRHMKTLLENHLAKLQIIKPEDRVMIPEKTAEEFKPFSTLNEKQMDRIQKVLQKKNPCEISVRELIEMTNDKQVKCSEVCTYKRARKNRIESVIEKRICDILQYKHCYITKWRRPSGRPKKFYIFYPGGRKPKYFENENTAQLSTVTSTLLLNALEIDGKKAMAVYKTLSPKNKKALKQFYELLCKCFPQTPPKVTRTTPGQSISTVSSAANSSASTSTSSGSTVTTTAQSKTANKSSSKGTTSKRKGSLDSDEPKKKMGCPQIRCSSSDTEDENLQKKSDESMSKIIDSIVESARLETCGHEEEKVDEPIRQTRSKGKSPKKAGKIPKTIKKEKTSPGRKRTSTDNQGEEPSAKVTKLSNVVPITMTTTVSSPGSIAMPKIITLNKSSAAGGPVPTALIMNTSINKPEDHSMVAPMMIFANTLKRGQQLPTSNPRVIVLRQPSVSPCAKKFPILPPCVTTMRGYEEFLIQSNLLKSRAGDMYNPYFYNERAGVLKSRLKAVKKENVVSKLDFNDKIDRALEHGAKKVNAVLGGRGVKLEKTSFMIHPKKDLLKNVRHTPEYIKLKKRFDALFLWPAFLSLLKPEKENVFDKVDKDTKLVTYDEWVETDTKEDRKPEVKTEEKETEEIKEEKPKTAYTEARVKLFQKHKQQYRDKKLQLRMKRRMAKLLQMKSIAEKGREKIREDRKAKEEENLKKKINRFKHLGKRKSKRLLIKQEKTTVDDTPDSQSTKPKLRSLKSLTREMQKGKKRKVISTSESKKSENDNKVSMTTANATNSNEPIIPNVAQASGQVIPPGFIMIPSPGQMLNMSGMVGGIMPQLSAMLGGMIPMMLPQQSSTLTPTTQTIGTLPQGMIPMMLPQQSSTLTPTTQTIGTLPQGMIPMMLPPQSSTLTQTTQTIGTLPQGMMQPMFLMPPATSGASTSTMTPFPFLLMPSIEGNNALSAVAIPQNATAQTNSGSSPMVGQYQGLQSPPIQPPVATPEMSTNSIMPMIETSSPTVPTLIVSPEKASVKSTETPTSSEMSHVFLGTSAKGGNSMLISIPKDSNMTVKELIQMMGNRGENSELETEGDNPIVNLMGENSKNNAMGDNFTNNAMGDNSMKK